MTVPTEKQIETACAVYWGDHWNVFNATKVSIRETMSKALSAALAVEAGAIPCRTIERPPLTIGDDEALTPASSAVEGEAVATGLMNGPLEEMAGYAPELFAERDQADWWLVRTDMGKVIFHGPDKARADRVAAIHGRTAEPLWSHLAPTPAGDAMLRLAVAAVLEADKEFRSNMGPSWEGDPLSDEIDGLRRIFEALLASPAPNQEGRADG